MSEVRLIDANALSERLKDLDEWCGDVRKPGIEQARCMVHESPTVDAEVVRHGRWEPQTWYDEKAGKDRRAGYGCSLCRHASAIKHPGCPWCRAKMDAKEGESNG